MKNKIIFISVAVLLLLGVGGYFYFKTNRIRSNDNNYGVKSSLISPALAEFVASEYLPKYYPGNHLNAGYFIFYSLEGKPAKYAFIYRTSGYELDTLEKIEGAARTITTENRKSFYSNIFTVVTGANNIDSLINRTYRGLPEVLIKKDVLENKIKTDYVDKKIKFGRLIFLSAMDIRYELISIENFIKEGQPALSDSYLIDKNGGLEKVSDIRGLMERKKSRRASESAESPESEEEQKNIIDSLNSNIIKWKEFEKKYLISP